MSCQRCDALASAGVTEQCRESCPAPAEELSRFEAPQGHAHNRQLRRCDDCGTWYQYRYHHEFDVGGSWDEEYLWRLPAEARSLDLLLVVGCSDRKRLATHTALLGSPAPTVRAAAALAAWIAVDRGRPVPIEPLVQGLVDADGGDDECYRALLSYIRRGARPAAEVLEALEGSDVPGRDERYCWILLRDARAATGRTT